MWMEALNTHFFSLPVLVVPPFLFLTVHLLISVINSCSLKLKESKHETHLSIMQPKQAEVALKAEELL